MEELNVGLVLLWIALILLAGRLGLLLERFGQPPVLGEILVGVVLGNLSLIGINFFVPVLENEIIEFLAQFGAVILLFQVGLQSHIGEMRKVGIRAFLVATVGVVVPFFLGTYVIGPLVLPGLPFSAYLFLGATLTATSVGITARVFQDLGILNSPEAQIVLGAAVIDDVMGLIILAIVTAIVTAGSVNPMDIAFITVKAFAFLAGAIVLGRLFAPNLGRAFSKIHTGTGMKFTLAIAFALIISYLAGAIGLAPIVGAFAAGLVLDPVHFQHFEEPALVEDIRAHLRTAPTPTQQELLDVIDHHSDRHVHEIINPLGWFFVPIFFVVTGMHVQLAPLFEPSVIWIALAITVAAFVGKVVSGLVAGNVNKSLVGWGMVPRGEVGLIFAATGQRLGIVNAQLFSVIVVVVILTTLLTPPILTWISRRQVPIPA